MKTGESYEVELDKMCDFMYDRTLNDSLDDIVEAGDTLSGADNIF